MWWKSKDKAQFERVRKAVAGMSRYDRAEDWLSSIIDAFGTDERVADRTLENLRHWVFGLDGSEYVRVGDEWDVYLDFWRRMTERFPAQPRLRRLHAETLLMMDRISESMEEFLSALEADPHVGFPGDLNEFMQGDPRWWRDYRLLLLRGALERNDDGDEDDYIQELLAELKHDYRDEPATLARIQEQLDRAGWTSRNA